MEELKKAIAIFEKLQKENTKAQAEAREANEAEREAWSAWRADGSFFSRLKDETASAAHDKAMQASEEAKAKRKKAKIAFLAMKAASQNATNAAANLLKNEILKAPEKWTNPIYYERNKKAVNAIFGNDNFYLTSKYCRITLNYKKGLPDADDKTILYADRENMIEPEKIKEENTTILDEKTIKAEARQAEKDAAKIEKIHEEAAAKIDKIRNTYKSEIIKYMLPYETAGIANNPRYF